MKRTRLSVVFVLALSVTMIAAILAPAMASVTYGNGFKWTFWDPANTAHSDWVDAVGGRTTFSWAPNPSGDAASISDPANAGKWSGSGESDPWLYVHTTTGAIASEPVALCTQNYGWASAGYWSVPGQYGNSGIYKDGHADGVGAGAPHWVVYPVWNTEGMVDSGFVWLGFQAPVDGMYSFSYTGWAGLLAYKGTSLVQAQDLGLSFTTAMTAGQTVYIRSQGAVDGSGWTTTDYYSVTLATVPEPSGMLALCVGIPSLLAVMARRRRA